MLQNSVDTTDTESSESENRSTAACEVDIIDEILATLNECIVSSSQSLRDKQNVIQMIKCFYN